MARLNEPPISTDSPEILRRKLLRQNRDLAKANSVHLTRIRALEAQNAQLLSEKLELCGRVIELEKKAEDNEARRVADHALDIRAKLEAQLLDCITVLGELGNEPPRKRHASPRDRRTSSSHTVLFRSSPPQKRPRESAMDAELRALQEGRLPPIQEYKSYPRRTMDREEILALCLEAADTTDSPELGPPPTSRFVDNEAGESQLQSPTKSPPDQSPLAVDFPSETLPSPVASPPFTDSPIKAKVEKATPDEPLPQNEDIAAPSTKCEVPAVSEPAPRASSKRKFGAGDESKTKATLSSSDGSKSKTTAGRPTLRIERRSSRASREAASTQHEAIENPTAPISVRVPLAAKSTNEGISSPKKSATSKPPVGNANLKSGKAGDETRRDRRKAKPKDHQEPAVAVPIAPPPSPKPVIDVLPPSSDAGHTEAAGTESASPSPSSPGPMPAAPPNRDTPPPTDISSQGETSRPSRRARAAVSYAEPNLRDKMRRPTEELFDAVSGDIRWKSRASIAKSEEPPSTGPTTKKPSPALSEANDTSKRAPKSIPTTSEALASAGTTSPLADKKAKPDRAPSANVTEPKQRQSSAALKSAADSRGEGCDESAKLQTSPGAMSNDLSSPSDQTVDPYEFPSSTPASDKFGGTTGKDTGRPAPRRKSKSSRRLSSLNSEDFDVDDANYTERSKPAATRKRTSLAHSRSTARMGTDDSPDDSELKDVESRSSSRRRSMML
ncbi:hypothetical protein ACRALDRAFT_1082666 [Sodiomyces alcalophilus JCM 7366]|uniref:uncharacterized protein n=1 Tax=Sodiomyces alcalophilus JCM 7366 TaxID=591952 RepID=UPI0039B5B419